ncbi:DNA-binding transcriptional regulator, XRE-family HTH domain [Alteribacillus persepolensis]|uniref:DNA-binding transcriptional regulator, XRE-family HTH domain n=1 Tax=Alteribacillus persepolensis TaxID=568899 RepID=A0A1G8GUB4_9BACI|nr:helix-turn-helix transcriptional regulator [Alteribacillus persepolensis]SDH98005.1 DNA-binding transcriptional regulator, XRE-family HTH domain [Alteribacillus persepolensis]
MTAISTSLKELREQHGLTSEELAKDVNFTKSIIWSYELGKKEPSISHLMKLADYFQVSIDYLVRKEETDKSIDLDNSHTLEYYQLRVDEKELNQEELVDLIAFIKAKRVVKQEQH